MGMDTDSDLCKNCISLWLVHILVPKSLPSPCLLMFGSQNYMLPLAISLPHVMFVIEESQLPCYLFCIDNLTKYTKLIPCFMGEDLLTAEQISLLFFQHVVWYFDIPIFVLHNKDPIFTSYFGQSLWKLLGSHAITISTNYPQADGLIECMTYSLSQILCAYLLYEDQDNWPDYVAITKMAINSSINTSIQNVPFEVLYSEKVLFPVDFLLSRESSINP